MRRMRWHGYGLLGLCAAALMQQTAQAVEPYFRFDAGPSVAGDIDIDTVGGFSLPIGIAGGPYAVMSPEERVLFQSYPSKIASQINRDIALGNIDRNALWTYNRPEFKLNTGFRVDATFGLGLSRVFALEFETGIIYNSFSSRDYSLTVDTKTYTWNATPGSLWQIPVLVNGMFTLFPTWKVRPYLGAGVGGLAAFPTAIIDSYSVAFAFQFVAGVKYQLNDTLDVGLSYKALGSGRHHFYNGIGAANDITTSMILNHSIEAGLTIHF